MENMDKKEFGFLLKQGEGLKLEFKENFDSKGLGKEIVAFANTEGGRIFIGVKDDGRKNGIKITVQDWHCPPYPQQFNKLGFIPDLSIIDLFMNVSPQNAAKILLG